MLQSESQGEVFTPVSFVTFLLYFDYSEIINLAATRSTALRAIFARFVFKTSGEWPLILDSADRCSFD